MKYKHPSNCLPIIYAMRMASIWLIVCGLPTIVDLVIMLILKDTNIGNVARRLSSLAVQYTAQNQLI